MCSVCRQQLGRRQTNQRSLEVLREHLSTRFDAHPDACKRERSTRVLFYSPWQTGLPTPGIPRKCARVVPRRHIRMRTRAKAETATEESPTLKEEDLRTLLGLHYATRSCPERDNPALQNARIDGTHRCWQSLSSHEEHKS